MNQTENIKKNNKIHMIISDGENETYYCKDFLYSSGFRYSTEDRKWYRDTTSMKSIRMFGDFANRFGLSFIYFDDTRVRDNSYRQTFFDNNKPMIGDYYICAYCFKPMKKEKVTVDHIIAVRKSQKNKLANWLMDRMDIQNVNDEKNLCCACRECNSRKGTKGGLWILRGFLGKKKGFVWTVYIFTIALIIFLIGMMIQFM